MAVERLAPDAILSQSNLSGSLAAIVDDPDSPDANWLTASSNNSDSVVRVSFPTPSGVLDGTQEFRARVRKFGGSGTPQARIDLYLNGSLVKSGSAVGVSGSGVIATTFTAADLGTTDGTGVEAEVVGVKSGGSPSTRASIEVGAVEWNASYLVPSTDRAALVAWAEAEVPTAPRAARISFAEVELPTAPRTAAVAWAEVEVPTPPQNRGARVAWAEVEIPTAPRSAAVAWAEVEIPNGPSPDRSALVAWSEIEVPTAPRSAHLAWAEIEVGIAPRAARITWVAVEVPQIGGPPPRTYCRGTLAMMGVGG